jgi:hypothetical protein
VPAYSDRIALAQHRVDNVVEVGDAHRVHRFAAQVRDQRAIDVADKETARTARR